MTCPANHSRPRPRTLCQLIVLVATLATLVAACDEDARSTPDDPDGTPSRSSEPSDETDPEEFVVTRSTLSRGADAQTGPDDELLAIDTREVRDLVQLDNGELVIATTGGLLWLDSDADAGERRIRHLTRRDGLVRHELRALHLDRRGELWIAYGTDEADGHGACQILDSEGDLRACPSELDDARITAWVEADSTLHALTWRGRHFRIDSDGDVTEARGAPSFTHAAVACGVGVYAASRGHGVARWTGTDGWRPLADAPRLIDAVTCHDGELWVGGPRGLQRWSAVDDDDGWQPVELETPRRHVTALASDGARLLVGLADGHVHTLDVSAGTLSTIARADRRVSVMTLDGPAVWIAGYDLLARAFVLGGEPAQPVTLRGPGDVDVSDVATAGASLAIATFRRGLGIASVESTPHSDRPDQTPPHWSRVTQADGLPSEEINTVVGGPRGRTFWAGTSRGLAHVARDGTVLSVIGQSDGLPCLHVNDLLLHGETLFVALSCGVAVLDADNGIVLEIATTDDGLPHRIVYALAIWDDRLVAGTNDGLASRALEGGDWNVVRSAPTNELLDNWITALAVDDTNTLWVGTYSGGLYRASSPGALVRVPGPRYVNLNAIHPRGNGVLVGGLSEGLWRVRGRTVEHLAGADAASCLPGRDVTGFATLDSGDVLVATRAGAWTPPAQCEL